MLSAAGEPVPVSLLDRLADGVLAAPLPALALQVREGGDHRLGRAIDLAEQVLRAGRTVEKGSEREAG